MRLRVISTQLGQGFAHECTQLQHCSPLQSHVLDSDILLQVFNTTTVVECRTRLLAISMVALGLFLCLQGKLHPQLRALSN